MYEDLIEESLGFASTALLLLLSWGIGQRILEFWERRKMQSEIDLASLTELQRLYGEFRTVGRLWRTHGLGKSESDPIACPDDVHRDLHERAAAAEGAIEALVVKLATERRLDADQARRIGILRESYQVLRRAVRDRRWFYWKSGSPEYELFNEVAVEVTTLLATPGARPTATDALKNVRAICAVKTEHLDDEAARWRPRE